MDRTKLNQRYHISDQEAYTRAKRQLERALSLGVISESDKDLISKFGRHLKLTVRPHTYMGKISSLIGIRRFFTKDYADVDDDDYIDAFLAIQEAVQIEHKSVGNPNGVYNLWANRIGKPYTHNTKVGLKMLTKRFFTFLYNEGLTKVSLKTINEIPTGKMDKEIKTENDVLTAEEIELLIRTTPDIRYKAYIGVLYESGARSIEIGNLKWSDVIPETWGFTLRITDTKTNKMRTVPCVTYAPYLRDWANHYHHGKPEGENFVFITPRGQPIRYQATEAAIRRIAKDAGITKKITLHRFRHTRITHVLREGMNETLVKKAFWGNQNTSMIATYSHLTSDDVRNEYLRMAGVSLDTTTKNEAPKPLTCPNCLKIWPPGTSFCTCGEALSEAAKARKVSGEADLDVLFARLSQSDQAVVISRFMKLMENIKTDDEIKSL